MNLLRVSPEQSSDPGVVRGVQGAQGSSVPGFRTLIWLTSSGEREQERLPGSCRPLRPGRWMGVVLMWGCWGCKGESPGFSSPSGSSTLEDDALPCSTPPWSFSVPTPAPEYDKDPARCEWEHPFTCFINCMFCKISTKATGSNASLTTTGQRWSAASVVPEGWHFPYLELFSCPVIS